jgi:hypothetical protein
MTQEAYTPTGHCGLLVGPILLACRTGSAAAAPGASPTGSGRGNPAINSVERISGPCHKRAMRRPQIFAQQPPFVSPMTTNPFEPTGSKWPSAQPKPQQRNAMRRSSTAGSLPHQQPHTSGIQGHQREQCPRLIMLGSGLAQMNTREHQEMRRVQ